jgi:hypothetical protein
VKKTVRKYFISGLALLLVLSNFSFATQLMFCQMSDDAKVCECTHKKDKQYEGVSLTKVKPKCCTEETTELSNSNILLTFKTELPHDIYVLGALANNYTIDLNLIANTSVSLITDTSQFPKLDIPTFNSSLLI